MVPNSLVTLNLFIAVFLTIGCTAARSNKKDSYLKQLTDGAEQKLLMLIVALPSEESESEIRLGELKADDGNDEKEDNGAAELLRLLLKPQSNKLLDANVETYLRTALRTDCQKKVQCQNKCQKKKSCNNKCKVIFDVSNSCRPTTTTKRPCQKRGRTMPPHWKMFLRAWKNDDEKYEC